MEWRLGPQVELLLGDIAVKAAGMPLDALVRGLAEADREARLTWAYGVSRGVRGTPWFFLNDLPYTPKASPSSVEVHWPSLCFGAAVWK